MAQSTLLPSSLAGVQLRELSACVGRAHAKRAQARRLLPHMQRYESEAEREGKVFHVLTVTVATSTHPRMKYKGGKWKKIQVHNWRVALLPCCPLI